MQSVRGFLEKTQIVGNWEILKFARVFLSFLTIIVIIIIITIIIKVSLIKTCGK